MMRWVHPRIRGEYRKTLLLCGAISGSPPHTRGILVKIGVKFGVAGFTPAYAGNTKENKTPLTAAEVHPRIRGEYPERYAGRAGPVGSPPHTRGIRKLVGDLDYNLRFTPAYAGNTRT